MKEYYIRYITMIISKKDAWHALKIDDLAFLVIVWTFPHGKRNNTLGTNRSLLILQQMPLYEAGVTSPKAYNYDSLQTSMDAFLAQFLCCVWIHLSWQKR
jgi:hypothetical protein